MFIIEKLKLGSAFSGIGAWEEAFKNLGIDYDLQFFSEIDPYAIKSYCAIHNEPESKNIGDIITVDVKKLPDIDVLVYSPPCQAFSAAGRQLGFEDKRGILFFDALKIIEEKKPKYALMENVKGLTSKKFENEFALMLQSLEEAGYSNYLPPTRHNVLNATDYGMCQNRERVFIVSIRKDIDDGNFEFPKPISLEINLKDITNIKFDVKGCSLRTRNYMGQPQQLEVRKDNVSNTVITVPKDCMIAIVDDLYAGRPARVYDEVAPTLRADRQGLKVLELEDILEPDAKPPILHNIYGGFKEKEPRIFNDYSPTIRTAAGGGHIPSVCTTDESKVEKVVDGYRIRKLTPLECFRLQGFSDESFFKAKNAGVSNTQLYRQAGNSICVPVPQAIIKKLFDN